MEPQAPASAQSRAILMPRSMFVFSTLYGGLVVLAGVLGIKIASLGHWPVVGDLAVESGIFAFLLLVVLSSAVAELHGTVVANRLVRFGFIPLIVSMSLLTLVIHVVPPAPFWQDQDAYARLLGQGARMQFAGLVSYGVSQTLNVMVFSRLSAGREGTMLMVRAWIASLLSQVVDTLIFITISFAGVLPLWSIMEGQIISKVLLSTIMVPPFIWLFEKLGRALDGE